MATARRSVCAARPVPGSTVSTPRSVSHAASAMASPAASVFTPVAATRAQLQAAEGATRQPHQHAGVEERGDRGAERQPAIAEDRRQGDAEHGVEQHRGDADRHRRAAAADRVERRRHDLDHRVADQAERVELHRGGGRDACRRARSCRVRTAAARSGRPAPPARAWPARSASASARSPRPASSACAAVSAVAASRDIAGVVAVAIDTPNRPIGRYITRNA